MMDIVYRIAELERKMANLIRVGVVSEADYPQARVRVQSGDMITGWLPWLTRRASHDVEWWAPEVGEQVLLLSPSGDPAQGVVLPAIYQTDHAAPVGTEDKHHIAFKDGTVIEYDRAAKKLLIDCVGQVDVHAAGAVNVTTDNKATITAASTVEIDGAASGAVKGIIQGDCLCALTGSPHSHISASVTGSK